MEAGTYYYDKQIRSYILQFMSIFSGMQVKVGKKENIEARLIDVPIHYGEQSRIVASILSDNTQNKPIRLPAMSAYMRNIDIAEARMTGSGTSRRNTYVPSGGLIPDDVKVVHQRKPIPYDIEMELNIYASNQDQLFQLFEQIFLLFDPQLTIQVSDGVFDWKRLSSVFLRSNRMVSNFPAGADDRILQSTMSFNLPVWIDSPADVRRDYVAKIFARIGAVSYGSVDSYDIIAELDKQGINYDLLFDANELTIT